MDAVFHRIALKVFSKPEDSDEAIEKSFLSLLPFNPEKEKLALIKTQAEGFNEREITIFELTLSKRSQIIRFTDDFFGKLDKDQKKTLTNQLETRLDEELHFFIRLDKPSLLKGERKITDSGNCFHCMFAVQVFPHKRSIALFKLNELLGGNDD